jgi:murein L,D-transpeptidase YcbB/YkuD
VRVENPLGLAAWVLDTPEWSRDNVTNATTGRDAQTVRVERPVHVVVLYATAAVADGLTYFAPDIYGHDTRLDRVLR